MVFHSLLLFIIEYANTRSDRIWNINFQMSIFSRLLFVLYTRHSNQASLSSTSNPSLPHCMPKQTTGSPPSLLGACNFHACIAYNSCTNDSHYHCAHTHADGISCIFWQIVQRPRHRMVRLHISSLTYSISSCVHSTVSNTFPNPIFAMLLVH